ncbi:restriction endonuclease [Burkholderia multivorans]|uniref:restriction endonuclease n=1 Tax=Burkholderia multivorans TaxID=87883 RepID=UPI0011B1CE46|nr:restriction endonuclease [Burkholderia multivorans]
MHPTAGPKDSILQPPYYDGQRLPLSSLSPPQFESFVFACFLKIQRETGIRITGKPSGSGDAGFDVEGESVATQRGVCLQCKRLQSPLGTAQVAEELAKVAATSTLDGSNIGVHQFLCSSSISQTLRRQIREHSRQQLIDAASAKLMDDGLGSLARLRGRLEAVGRDPREVVEQYVRQLDQLVVWGADEFDAALSSNWIELQDVVEQHFKVATVVREHPRATFNRSGYLATHRNFTVVVEPRIRNAALPEGLATSSAADPRQYGTMSTHTLKSLDDIRQMDDGELAIILGDGGIGKTAALSLLRANTARESSDSMLAVVISLANYLPGSINATIHQELGVVHGNWQTLPDRILLLCDGLNECPAPHMQAFLNELKPLLDRNRVVCVIATRDSSRRSRLVLPKKPSACVQLEDLTPMGVRRLAQAELPNDEASEFVRAYRALSDRSGSPHFWTPFAVLAAIGLWREAAELPATLGEILQALLLGRCRRNNELGDELAPDVILQLAGALAFHGIFHDGRLECPATQAGKWIGQARQLCSDALGVSGMKDTEVVNLLIQHELLRKTENGHLHFGHQLIAGALSARFLARNWRQHGQTLGESVADDAWVFAAQLVPDGERIDFLKAIFEADVVLGSQAALEMPREIQASAEQWLLYSVAPQHPEVARARALHGLSNLKSENAIGKLRQLAVDKRDPVHYAARRALSASGDVAFLRALLVEMDRIKSTPITMTGGNVAVWECAPLPVRLDLARQRLIESSPGDLVAESLFHVAYERDADDEEIVVRHLDAASDLGTWQVALFALQQIAPQRATKKANAAISAELSITGKANLIRSATSAGIEIDVSLAFACATADLSDVEASTESNFHLGQLIDDVLRKKMLPPELVEQVEKKLPPSLGERRLRLWQLAAQCPSLMLAKYSLECIRQWGDDAGSACAFFLEQHKLRNEYADELLTACETGLRSELDWHCWRTERALKLVAELGFSADVVELLSSAIRRLSRVREVVERESVHELDLVEQDIASKISASTPRHGFEYLVSSLIPAAALARKLLPKELLLSFLYYDTHSIAYVRDDFRAIFSDLDDEEIDTILVAITDEWTLLSGLLALSIRPATPVRIDLLRRCLESGYMHPAKRHLIEQAIDACWNDGILVMVTDVIARIEDWPEAAADLFWSFVRMVARHLVTGDVAILQQALARAVTPFARRILTIWRDGVSRGEFKLPVTQFEAEKNLQHTDLSPPRLPQ